MAIYQNVPLPLEGIEWRDQELGDTQHFIPITDHPKHAEIMEYRAALWAWPDTEDFPDTKPVNPLDAGV